MPGQAQFDIVVQNDRPNMVDQATGESLPLEMFRCSAVFFAWTSKRGIKTLHAVVRDASAQTREDELGDLWIQADNMTLNGQLCETGFIRVLPKVDGQPQTARTVVTDGTSIWPDQAFIPLDHLFGKDGDPAAYVPLRSTDILPLITDCRAVVRASSGADGEVTIARWTIWLSDQFKLESREYATDKSVANVPELLAMRDLLDISLYVWPNPMTVPSSWKLFSFASPNSNTVTIHERLVGGDGEVKETQWTKQDAAQSHTIELSPGSALLVAVEEKIGNEDVRFCFIARRPKAKFPATWPKKRQWILDFGTSTSYAVIRPELGSGLQAAWDKVPSTDVHLAQVRPVGVGSPSTNSNSSAPLWLGPPGRTGFPWVPETSWSSDTKSVAAVDRFPTRVVQRKHSSGESMPFQDYALETPGSGVLLADAWQYGPSHLKWTIPTQTHDAQRFLELWLLWLAASWGATEQVEIECGYPLALKDAKIKYNTVLQAAASRVTAWTGIKFDTKLGADETSSLLEAARAKLAGSVPTDGKGRSILVCADLGGGTLDIGVFLSQSDSRGSSTVMIMADSLPFGADLLSFQMRDYFSTLAGEKSGRLKETWTDIVWNGAMHKSMRLAVGQTGDLRVGMQAVDSTTAHLITSVLQSYFAVISGYLQAFAQLWYVDWVNWTNHWVSGPYWERSQSTKDFRYEQCRDTLKDHYETGCSSSAQIPVTVVLAGNGWLWREAGTAHGTDWLESVKRDLQLPNTPGLSVHFLPKADVVYWIAEGKTSMIGSPDICVPDGVKSGGQNDSYRHWIACGPGSQEPVDTFLKLVDLFGVPIPKVLRKNGDVAVASDSPMHLPGAVPNLAGVFGGAASPGGGQSVPFEPLKDDKRSAEAALADLFGRLSGATALPGANDTLRTLAMAVHSFLDDDKVAVATEQHYRKLAGGDAAMLAPVFMLPAQLLKSVNTNLPMQTQQVGRSVSWFTTEDLQQWLKVSAQIAAGSPRRQVSWLREIIERQLAGKLYPPIIRGGNW